MQIGRVLNATRVLGKSQGFKELPVRDERTTEGSPVMVTAWLPTPKELEAMRAGAPVHVKIMGIAHPPIMVEVGEVPER